jgi:Flp pilus assembly secretin CpaC
MTRLKNHLLIALFGLLALSAPAWAADGLLYVETADGNRSVHTRELVQWTHARMVFRQDLTRVAVGQNETMEVEILGGREVLILAKEIGRTSLIVWYPDETTETFLFNVIQDLSVLKRALKDVHPAIRLELAPDRDALVLRGTVPTVRHRVAAETIARDYLDAGSAEGDSNATLLVQDGADDSGEFRVAANSRRGSRTGSTSAVINLIQVEEMPMSTQDKIAEAINELGGADVRVKRIMRGDVEDDSLDTLLLLGQVENQVALVRVLNVASRLFLGEDSAVDSMEAVKAIADESGALIEERDQTTNLGQGSNQLNRLIGGGGSNNTQLENEIRANIGRAKLLSVADGRILSMIEVRDLPQVRVAVQLHEVNRNRLKTWNPSMTLVTGDYAASSFGPEGTGMLVQQDAAQRVGAAGSQQVDNALQILNGSLTNHLQIGGTDLAFDLLFSLLESEGISRTLSRPTLTVLAGESALFQVGGEVPVPSSFAPPGTDASGAGVFTGTNFRAFGVQLAIRPMVDENDRITLDVQPTVSLPDTLLTQEIAGSTGSNLNTTAFNTRSLQTTTRLRDGQTLVLGGLVSRGFSNQKDYTPGLDRVPLVGWLGKASNTTDADRELIIIVTPTIVREPRQDVALWEFPGAYELLIDSVGLPASLFEGEDQ